MYKYFMVQRVNKLVAIVCSWIHVPSEGWGNVLLVGLIDSVWVVRWFFSDYLQNYTWWISFLHKRVPEGRTIIHTSCSTSRNKGDWTAGGRRCGGLSCDQPCVCVRARISMLYMLWSVWWLDQDIWILPRLYFACTSTQLCRCSDLFSACAVFQTGMY